MSSVSYKSKSGVIYSNNGEGWTRKSKPIGDSIYTSLNIAREAFLYLNGGTPVEKIMEACRKKEIDLPGGVILYIDEKGRLAISRQITERTPPFDSLDDEIERALMTQESEESGIVSLAKEVESLPESK